MSDEEQLPALTYHKEEMSSRNKMDKKGSFLDTN